MAFENTLLAGGAALSLLAGVVAGQYALLPAHGGSNVQEMTPLRFSSSAAAPESPWREARWTAPPAAAPRAVEDVNVADDDRLPPDPPAMGEAPPAATDGVARDGTIPAPTAETGPPTSPLSPQAEPDRPPMPAAQDAPAPSAVTLD